MLCIAILAAAAGFVFLVLLTMVKGPEARENKARYLRDHQCEIVGYYGQSGDYKVYNCMGRLVKEGDL